jgi:ankyrin repeat protein
LDQISAPHSFIVTTCLTYLSTFEFTTRKISSQEELENFLNEIPFLEYAYEYWGSHAKVCYEEDGLPNIVSDFLLRLDEYPCRLDEDGFDLFGQFHIAAYYGLRDRLPVTKCNQLTARQKYTPFILACYRGNEDIVNLLLCRDVDINAQGGNGNTALILASAEGHVSIVKSLVSHDDIALNIQDEDGWTALMAASGDGHEAVAGLLLACNDITINTQNEHGWTALIIASANGHEAVVQLLLSHSEVALNTQDENGRTALMLASTNGHKAVVQLLLSHNDIAPNTQDENGWTALFTASCLGHKAIARLLLAHDC